MEFVWILLAYTIGTIFGYVCRVFLVRKMRYSGVIIITDTEDKKIFSLELDTDPDVLEVQDEVIFKVVANPSEKGPSQ